MGETKKYFWLKLKRDFFKRHDITILEGMPEGKDLVLLYLKLMTESVDHEGRLRFSDEIPYTPLMLASLTHSDPEFMARALEIFGSFGLIVKEEDGTLFLPKVVKMIGSAVDNDHAKRQQRYRERLKNEDSDAESDAERDDGVTQSDASVTQESDASVTQTVTKSDESIEIEKEIEIDKDKEKSKKEKHKFGSYENVLLTDDEYNNLVTKYGAEADEAIEYLSAYIVEKGYKSKSHNLSIQRWVIEAIRERKAKATPSKPKPSGITPAAKQINTMITRDTDLSDLEKRLVANWK